MFIYPVLVSFVDDILGNEIDNIYPTQEDAIRGAKDALKDEEVYSVEVLKNELTPDGMRTIATIYRQKEESRL